MTFFWPQTEGLFNVSYKHYISNLLVENWTYLFLTLCCTTQMPSSQRNPYIYPSNLVDHHISMSNRSSCEGGAQHFISLARTFQVVAILFHVGTFYWYVMVAKRPVYILPPSFTFVEDNSNHRRICKSETPGCVQYSTHLM